MKIAAAFLSLVCSTTLAFEAHAANAARQRLSLDFNWAFSKGDPAGAEAPGFDDSNWRRLDVPHDWSIEGPYAQTNSTQGSGGYLPAGIGWYRRHFATPTEFSGKRVSVHFDGVYRNASVYLNGRKIGTHPYGYTGFSCDLTDTLAPAGKENVLAVRVANDIQPSSRWYSGSGIYRHVWMDVTAPVHVAEWGVYVTTPQVSSNAATIVVRTLVENDAAAEALLEVRQDLVDPAGMVVAGVVDPIQVVARGHREILQTITIERPRLWSLEDPALYSIRTGLVRAHEATAELIDQLDTAIGIRSVVYDATQGFLLNGGCVKMLGMCLHHDGGAVGAAVPVEVWERRMRLLKAMGCNAIRCSHNPPAPEFLELCDRLGFLVMDEAFDEWTVAKAGLRGSYATLFAENWEQDLTSMLHRDRNHPSILLWSIGNEIPEQSSQAGVELARKLTALCHAEDPTRPVTSACDNVHAPKPTLPGFLEALDIAGYNYVDRWGRFRELYFSEDHVQHPNFKFLGTEDVCVGGLRGNYFDADAGFQGVSSPFSYASAMIRAEQLWKFNAIHDYVIGYFMWTGIDYLGESRWPRKSASSGVLDTCGFRKSGYYFYQSQWTTAPMVHILPHWNYPGKPGTVLPVVVYSNCREVELQLNGRSYGVKSLVFPRPGSVRSWNDRTPTGTTADLHLTWDVAFEPGTIKAIGMRDGSVVAQEEVRTASAPAAIELSCDKRAVNGANRGVAQVEIRVLDADGNFVPTATNLIHIDVQGPAKIIGMDNGDPLSHDPYQGNARPAFNGMALVLLQANGTKGQVNVKAAAEGLRSASAEFEVESGMPVPRMP